MCATGSNPAHGFTDKAVKVGMYAPLGGPIRPIYEGFFRVLRYSLQIVNQARASLAVPELRWGCAARPGVYGRRIEAVVLGVQNGTPEELLAAARRLVEVEKVFMLGFCDPRNANGAAARYLNARGVPSLLCSSPDMPFPQLGKWTWEPVTDDRTTAALYAGYLMKELGRTRLAVLADPSMREEQVPAVQRAARHLGHPIPDDCIVYKPGAEAPTGMHAEVTQLRRCYGTGSPDAVIALDSLLAIYGALAAKALGWRPADSGVTWVCSPSCWITAIAELCGDACEGMVSDCAVLPCIPWADPQEYPAVRLYRQIRQDNFPSEPEDLVTYGGASVPFALSDFLGLVGPDLSRENFRTAMNGMRNWDPGIGPVITFTPTDHTGAEAVWLIELTGKPPWFADLSGDFVTLKSVGIPSEVAAGP